MEKYTKDFLIKEIAARAYFTVSDVKIIWKTFEEIVEEVVAEHDELLIGGLFKVYTKEVAPAEFYHLTEKKKVKRDKTYRLVISPSTTLKRIAKYGNTQKSDPPESEG